MKFIEKTLEHITMTITSNYTIIVLQRVQWNVSDRLTNILCEFTCFSIIDNSKTGKKEIQLHTFTIMHVCIRE